MTNTETSSNGTQQPSFPGCPWLLAAKNQESRPQRRYGALLLRLATAATVSSTVCGAQGKTETRDLWIKNAIILLPLVHFCRRFLKSPALLSFPHAVSQKCAFIIILIS